MDLNWKELLKLSAIVAPIGTVLAFFIGLILSWSVNVWLPLGALIYFILFLFGSKNLTKTTDNFTEIFSIMFFLWFVAGTVAWIVGMIPAAAGFLTYLAWMTFSVEALFQMLVFTVASLGIIGLARK